MSSINNIIDVINFICNNENIYITYKKIILREFINNYMTDDNKDDIQKIIKNYNIDIFNYLFLNKTEKNKITYQKSLSYRKEYYNKHRDKLNEQKKQHYQEHREEELNKKKAYYYEKKKQKEENTTNNNQNE